MYGGGEGGQAIALQCVGVGGGGEGSRRDINL